MVVLLPDGVVPDAVLARVRSRAQCYPLPLLVQVVLGVSHVLKVLVEQSVGCCGVVYPGLKFR